VEEDKRERIVEAKGGIGGWKKEEGKGSGRR
jgi:hypothetical protein